MNALATSTRKLFIAFVFAQVIPIACCAGIAGAQSPGMSPIYEGFTQPRFEIMVAATEIGRIESVEVEVGDRVHEGQLIAQMENSLQASSVKIAKLQAQMRGEVEAARAEATLHRNRIQKIRELAADGMARPDELFRGEADLRIAEARELASTEQQSLRKLELERYELQLERRRVTAPMNGVVAKVFHFPGEYLTPGDPAVIQLLVIDQLYAVFNIPVEETANLMTGDAVVVSLRSDQTTIRSRIASIAPVIDGESGTVLVRVMLDNKDGKLRSGDRCTLQISKSNSANANAPSRTSLKPRILGGSSPMRSEFKTR